MDLAPPTLDPPPAPPPDAATPAPADGKVLGGVAALLSSRLGVDPLWIRLTFVLTTLVSGVGAVAYAGCWLGLVVGSRRRDARIAGGVLLVGGVPLVLLANGDAFLRGSLAVLVLLIGLAVALWQPRRVARSAPVTPRFVEPTVTGTAVAGTDVAERGVAEPAVVEPVAIAAPRERSVLGRLTLGIAAVVAALGALIDQANGGRMHPEQWLGGAAAVCGVGLVVGAFAGRARWLVLPATLFAGAGFVAGSVARVGLHDPALTGDHWVTVGEHTPAGARFEEHVVAGTVWVQIDGAPAEPVSVDARTGFGDVQVQVADGVGVEVRGRGGDVVVDGVARSAGTYRIGPEGLADVVVAARVGSGRIVVDRYVVLDAPATMATMLPGDERAEVVPGVGVGTGTMVPLAGGEAIVDADGNVVVGDFYSEGNVTVVPTSIGEFRLLPQGQLLTPYGQLVDLADVLAAGSERVPVTTVVPATTTTMAVTPPPLGSVPALPSVTTTVGG